ncbi:MAG: DNA ligase [Paracidovorax wautersii]|uniref:DNA ligase n=1 Tax=Paracidovorax wautersii TaxID=1177982 RepID=A0A7V8FPQ8_9BURK|nr:MAG: DNA ligase [Paracidovorax wautersii]
MLGSLSFVYTNAVGETKQRRLTNWGEVGHYIKGFDETAGKVLTFRKDRITEYIDVDDIHAILADPYSKPPPVISNKAAPDLRPHIVFTGFSAARRAELEQMASDGGLRVVRSVTQTLVFLCGGSNAGPMKLEKARAQGVYIVDETAFIQLVATGVLPDDAVEALQ